MTGDGQSTTGSALSEDSGSDKVVRFGCGAVLAGLVLVAAVLSGLGEPLGMAALTAVGIVVVVGSGILSVVYGEPYVERLLKFMAWL